VFPSKTRWGELKKLQDEGKIRHIGLSEVSVEELKRAEAIASIVSVQNRYNLVLRLAEDVLEYATEKGIAFIPFFPLATGKLASDDGPLSRISARLGVVPSQLAIAWLLKRSPVVLPIPGTSSLEHLEQNLLSADIELSADEYEELTKLV
jgi:pyridoxine 4-dehydrogenase